MTNRRSEPGALLLLDGGEGWALPLPGGRVDLDQAMLTLARELGDALSLDPDDAVDRASRAEVRFVRRLGWCSCGDGHAWHLEDARQGRPGAFPALVCWT